MSHNVVIFVRANSDLQSFAAEIGQLLGTEMTRYQHEVPYPISLYKKYDPYYYGSVPGGFVDVRENPLKSHHDDFFFWTYQFEISLRTDNRRDVVAAEQWLYDYGRLVFDKLKALNKYDLLMTDNVEFKLDEYEVVKNRATD